MDSAAVDIGKAAVIFLVIAASSSGSRASTSTGEELLDGGILIDLFIEFWVPVLMSVRH